MKSIFKKSRKQTLTTYLVFCTTWILLKTYIVPSIEKYNMVNLWKWPKDNNNNCLVLYKNVSMSK